MHDSRPTAGTDASPYFFLSYAATPAPGDHAPAEQALPDKNVAEFYADLSAEVTRMSGARPHVPVGYVEAPGRDSARTDRALHRCHSFVPLISRRYFTDTGCGRQWYGFTHRSPAGALLPVLWTPVPTTARPVVVDLDLPVPRPPATATRVDARTRELYAQDGLYGLRQDTDHAAAYAQCVQRIAQCVVQAARHGRGSVPAAGEPATLADLPDAFATSPWHPLGIAVLAPDIHHLPAGRSDTKYGPNPRDWQPFSDTFGSPLAERTAELARNLGFAPTVCTFDQAEPVLMGRQQPTGPWVLILDPWILHDRGAADRLRAFDDLDLPWVTVLTPLADDQQTRDHQGELAALLRTALPRRLARGRAIQRAAVAGIGNVEAFNSRFMELADSAAQRYLSRAPLPSSTRSGTPGATRPHAGSGGPAAPATEHIEPQVDQEAQP